jgi:hypothetical protein
LQKFFPRITDFVERKSRGKLGLDNSLHNIVWAKGNSRRNPHEIQKIVASEYAYDTIVV